MVTNTMIFRLILILFVILSSSSMAINISGNVFGVWGLEDNPYEVIGDLRVPQESTLIIEPGCYINFTSHFKFVVDTNALLIAEGTEDDSIYFIASDTTIGWLGLRFFKADTNCRIAYCILVYGKALGLNYHPYEMGGAIYGGNTNLFIDHCTLRNNETAKGEGGAIHFERGRLILSNSELCYNFCGFGGSGVFCVSADVSIQNCFFYKDSTWYSLGGDDGGAITLKYCTRVNITNSVIQHNFTGGGGGGIYILRSPSIINENIISDNQSYFDGAGVYMISSSVTFSKNLVYGNNSLNTFGGGLGSSGCQFTMFNNIVANNSSSGGGGGMWISLGYATLRNNIFWGNISYQNYQIYAVQETVVVAEYNDIQGGWPGEGNIDTDPMFVYPDTGNFHLSWANWPTNDSTKSPCIDTGDPSSPLDPDSTRADMGAYYFNQHPDDIDDIPSIPRAANLLNNYPNPFNSSTIIRYELPVSGQVTLDIYDILGRKVQTLLDVKEQAGSHQVIWDASGHSSGIYYYYLQAGDNSYTRPMILIK